MNGNESHYIFVSSVSNMKVVSGIASFRRVRNQSLFISWTVSVGLKAEHFMKLPFTTVYDFLMAGLFKLQLLSLSTSITSYFMTYLTYLFFFFRFRICCCCIFHSSGTAAPPWRHEYFCWKHVVFALMYREVLVGLQRCGAMWSPVVWSDRGWKARVKIVSCQSPSIWGWTLTRERCSAPQSHRSHRSACLCCSKDVVHFIDIQQCDMQHQTKPGITRQWSWFMQTNRKCLDSWRGWSINGIHFLCVVFY